MIPDGPKKTNVLFSTSTSLSDHYLWISDECLSLPSQWFTLSIDSRQSCLLSKFGSNANDTGTHSLTRRCTYRDRHLVEGDFAIHSL